VWLTFAYLATVEAACYHPGSWSFASPSRSLPNALGRVCAIARNQLFFESRKIPGRRNAISGTRNLPRRRNETEALPNRRVGRAKKRFEAGVEGVAKIRQAVQRRAGQGKPAVDWI